MKTISCHSNQSSYLTRIKIITFVEGNHRQSPMRVCQFSASSSLQFLRRRILNIFFENLPFMSPRQPIKLSYLDKSRMQHGGLLNKHICEKKKSNISSETAETVNLQFSYYKSMGTLSCHSNQSSYPTGIKNTTFVEANVLSMYAKFHLHPPYGF